MNADDGVAAAAVAFEELERLDARRALDEMDAGEPPHPS